MSNMLAKHEAQAHKHRVMSVLAKAKVKKAHLQERTVRSREATHRAKPQSTRTSTSVQGDTYGGSNTPQFLIPTAGPAWLLGLQPAR